jgi:hypothetical protein
MLRLNDYPSHDDMLQIDWHHTGVWDNPAASARATYYGASSAPDTYFDGIDHVLGAGDSTSAYNTYRTIVNNHHNNQWSQIILRDAIFNLDMDSLKATVTYTLEVASGETISNPANVKLRSAAYEDDLTWCCEPRTGNSFWNHIGRALGTETTLTVSQSGQTQQYTGTFTIDPTWNPDNLHVVIFAQRDSNKNVLQSAEACRAYSVAIENLSPIVVSSTVPVDFDVEVTYTGCLDDDVVVTLDKSALPGDWDAEIVVGANTFPNTTTFTDMTQGETQAYAIRVIPGASAALGMVSVDTGPATNMAAAKTETYRVFANTAAILYVNDDNNGSSQAMFESAITNAGHFYLTHDVDTQGEPSAELVAGFDAVVWNTGQSQANTISTTAQAALVSYLNGGGNVFVTSHGLLNQFGSSPTFIRNYLRVLSYQQDWQALSCTGVAGDPIGDGLSFSLSGPFPDFADLITPNTGGVIWLVGQFGDVAVHYDSGTFKTVFMTPALELAPSADRDLVVDRVLEWFFGTPTGVTLEPGAVPGVLSLAQNSPNPFAGATTLRFAVPAEGAVRLEVFDVAGRRVARLVDAVLPAGGHAVTWDGRDAAGSRVASGVYLYRLHAGGQSTSREMVLRK